MIKKWHKHPIFGYKSRNLRNKSRKQGANFRVFPSYDSDPYGQQSKWITIPSKRSADVTVSGVLFSQGVARSHPSYITPFLQAYQISTSTS